MDRHGTGAEICEAIEAGAHSRQLSRTVTTMLPIQHFGKEVRFESFAYMGAAESEQLLVLVHRRDDAGGDALPIVRVHSGCITGDVLHSLRCDCHAQLQLALTVIQEAGIGVLIYLPYHEGRGIGLFRKLQAYALQDKGADTVDANRAQGLPVDGRNFDLAAAALLDMKMPAIRLLSNNPAKATALARHGIFVSERVPLVVARNVHNSDYIETKKRRLNHDL